MQDVRESWCLILEVLASIERERMFQHPLLIMAKQRNVETDVQDAMQREVVTVMTSQRSTASYRSDHTLPLKWQLRVDSPKSTVGLVFIELEVRMPEGETFHAARLRIVTGSTHPGWTLEARGRMDLWRSGWNIFERFNAGGSTMPQLANDHPSFTPLAADRLQEVVKSLVDEADRIDRLLRQIWIGS